MNLGMARSIALAGAVALGALSEVLVCEPARADYYAFANTQDLDATLSLRVGNTWININTGGVQGWISNNSINIPGNSNYMVGVYNDSSYNDYFGFNLSGLRSATISSAKLIVYSGLINETVSFSLFGATQWISQLQPGSSPDATLYHGLMTGPQYDLSTLSANTADPTAQLAFTLNGLAVSDINAAIQNRSLFAISGHANLASAVLASSVPEPSTWVLMLAGFAGLGMVAGRRAARRRAAAPAG